MDPNWQVYEDNNKPKKKSIWSKMGGWLDSLDQKLTGTTTYKQPDHEIEYKPRRQPTLDPKPKTQPLKWEKLNDDQMKKMELINKYIREIEEKVSYAN